VLETSFTEIHNKNASTLSFEALFRSAYKLVLKKRHEDLHNKVQDFERAWLRGTVREKIINIVAPSILTWDHGPASDPQANERRQASERYMTAIKDAYQDHHMCMNMITDVLMYLVSAPPPLAKL
jgi:cullin 3